jgi:hypothetical protein
MGELKVKFTRHAKFRQRKEFLALPRWKYIYKDGTLIVIGWSWLCTVRLTEWPNLGYIYLVEE